MFKHPPKSLSQEELKVLYRHTVDNFPFKFHEIETDLVLVEIANYRVFVPKKDVFYVHYDEKTTILYPKYYVNSEDSELCLIEYKGLYYHPQSPLFVLSTDTKRKIHKNVALKGYRSSEYYEHSDGLVYNKRDDKWIPKNKVVITADTQRPEHVGNVYTSKNKYYRYSDFSIPKTNWRHAPYVSESVFPKDINERRIGIEYEFGNSFNMFDKFIQSSYIDYWNSVRDGSLDSIPQGIEFVSIPFKLQDINQAGDFLKFCFEHGVTINDRCGYHVHVGAQDFSFLDLSRLVVLCQSIEKDMFILGGQQRNKNTYCRSLDQRFSGFEDIVLSKDKNKVGQKLYSNQRANFERRHQVSKYIDAENHRGIRYYWFNIDRFFYKRKEPQQKTVEFRNHEATKNVFDFMNFAILCYYIVEYAKNHSKDTCKKSTIYDIIRFSHIKHRKQLIQYIKQKL